jgi:hypothetical protein
MKKVLIAAAMFFSIVAMGQNLCGTQSFIENRVKKNPELQAEYDAMFEHLKQMQQQGKPSSRAGKNVIYVPVVFHIIHDGDAYGTGENITDEQILSQIDALNRDFSLTNSDTANIPAIFKPLAANTYIQFCMAKFDPQGNPTTGIERLQFSKSTWDTEDDIEDQLKPSTIWNRAKYLNIWSCRFGGDLTSQGVLAYATLPYGTSNTTDGVVARFNTIGTTGVLIAGYRGGRTIVHEVGHWLGLLHNFNNGVCYNGSWSTSDFIDDTPDQQNRYFGCPSHPQSSCGSQDMFNNYMDYTDDGCRNMFTADQADRMYGVLTTTGQGNRGSFQTAISNCFRNLDGALAKVLLPIDTVCGLKFKPIIQVKNEGVAVITNATVYYKLNNGATQSFAWTGNLDIQQAAYVTLPELTVAEGIHTLSVSFENANGQPTDDDVNNDGTVINFYAYDGGVASTTPVLHDFEDGLYPPINWSIDNRGTANTWNTITNSGYGNGSYAAYINNLNYSSNPNRTKDALITEDYDVSTIGLPRIAFDLAYCRHSVNRADSLAVYYSFDCGVTWNQFFKSGGVELATAPDKVTLFTPAPEEWKTIETDLPALQGQTKVRFKFENISGWGNALYLDNINLSQSPNTVVSGITTATEKVEVAVYPNPAVNEAIVSLPVVHPFSHVEVYNAVGQKVFNAPITQRIVSLNTSGYARGTYFIRLFSATANQQHSFIIAR